jgi:hypothetical protein
MADFNKKGVLTGERKSQLCVCGSVGIEKEGQRKAEWL